MSIWCADSCTELKYKFYRLPLIPLSASTVLAIVLSVSSDKLLRKRPSTPHLAREKYQALKFSFEFPETHSSSYPRLSITRLSVFCISYNSSDLASYGTIFLSFDTFRSRSARGTVWNHRKMLRIRLREKKTVPAWKWYDLKWIKEMIFLSMRFVSEQHVRYPLMFLQGNSSLLACGCNGASEGFMWLRLHFSEVAIQFVPLDAGLCPLGTFLHLATVAWYWFGPLCSKKNRTADLQAGDVTSSRLLWNEDVSLYVHTTRTRSVSA